MPPNAASNQHALMSSLKCYGAAIPPCYYRRSEETIPIQNKSNKICQSKPTKPNQPNQIKQAKFQKQIYQIKATKRNLLNQT